MGSNSIGTHYTITSWGESHGPGVGVVIDGCPAGLEISEEDIQSYLDRRKPGTSKYTTPRKESDKAVILSGVFEGVTTGCPISVMVTNENQHSKDYSDIASVYRPGHADYTYEKKYGIRDYRGGGRSSGRETIARVIGGSVAVKILRGLGITIDCYTRSIGRFAIDDRSDICLGEMDNPLNMPSAKVAAEAMQYVEECMKNGDSAGGVIECVMHNVPAGIGEPAFDKLDSRLAGAIMSIGAVKGVEIGDGFGAALSTGSTNNDEMIRSEQNAFCTNHSGGILGGISSGQDIICRAAIKPTPSISSKQHTISASGEDIEISIKGRHDPIIVPRAVVVVESMAAMTLLDLMMDNMSARLEYLDMIYGRGN